MIIELLRLDNNQRIAISRHHLDDQWGWVLENMQSEFPHWWTQDVDSTEQPNGDELITIDGQPKAILKYRCGWQLLEDDLVGEVA